MLEAQVLPHHLQDLRTGLQGLLFGVGNDRGVRHRPRVFPLINISNRDFSQIDWNSTERRGLSLELTWKCKNPSHL